MAKFRAVCFTVNNPEGQLTMAPFIKYCVYQKEKGESGTEHFQGYAELQGQHRLAALKKWLPTAHFEARRGTAEQARAYCMKEDTRIDGPWEHGEYVPPQPGKRSDLDQACQVALEAGIEEAARQFPSLFAKYYKGLSAYVSAMKEKPTDMDFVPKVWQQNVLNLLEAEPNDRTIYWVHESRGNVGKSRLARHLIMEHGAVELHGKVADMAHAYQEQRIVVFDLARSQEEKYEHIYHFAEKLKNGVFFSPKYESGMKVFKAPHVIFFANVAPPSGVWSEDRVVEIDLSSPGIHKPGYVVKKKVGDLLHLSAIHPPTFM